MEKKNTVQIILAACIAACIAFGGGFYLGRNGAAKQYQAEREQIYRLNRESIAKMNVGDGPIYVIGHRSPDSDTVISAIVYARFLNQLGYEAEAAITEPVNPETAYILEQAGTETPQVLEDASGKNIFLVDHSEYAQAAEGMTDANIVGILDHHGVGSVNIGQQVFYQAKPIGATATIVWLDYLNYGFEIDQNTAYLLLGAILSDTNYLTGSSSTEADREAIESLSKIAGVSDVEALHKILHEKSMSYEGMSDEEIFFSDYKKYEASGVSFGIGLVNSIDEETSRQLADRMKAIADQLCAEAGVDLLYASVGIREGDLKIDYIIPLNEYSGQMMQDAFPDYDEYDGTSYIYRSGLGRKSKFVPGLTDYLAAHPHE